MLWIVSFRVLCNARPLATSDAAKAGFQRSTESCLSLASRHLPWKRVCESSVLPFSQPFPTRQRRHQLIRNLRHVVTCCLVCYECSVITQHHHFPLLIMLTRLFGSCRLIIWSDSSFPVAESQTECVAVHDNHVSGFWNLVRTLPLSSQVMFMN